MPDGLLDCIRAASRELALAAGLANDPTSDLRVPDLALVRRLQAAVGGVERAAAEASDEERERARTDPAYGTYLKNLAQLRIALDAWHGGLIARRAQLDRDAERLNAARRWAEAYRRTR